MRRFLLISAVALSAMVFFLELRPAPFRPERAGTPALREIGDVIKSGETLSGIFKKHGLNPAELFSLKTASASVHNLGRLSAGRPYTITLDGENRIQAVTYCINDDCTLKVTRAGEGFSAQKVAVDYERNTVVLEGAIKENLVSAMDDLALALELSDIFAWDIDFTTDLRKGDTFRLLVEELRLNGELKKYGGILSAEFTNNGRTYNAYRFGDEGYFDAGGNSLRRAFLKAPLSYRKISSGFSKSRYHPVLKTYRPHLGVDYAAPAGTPVSAIGGGTVTFAGYKGDNGNLVVVRHTGGFTTSYGHLQRVVKGIRAGVKVAQGQVVGYVGSTGLSTGPHLDFRVKKDGRSVNPLALKPPKEKSLKGARLAEFKARKGSMDAALSGEKTL